jgi:hypothetical protein
MNEQMQQFFASAEFRALEVEAAQCQHEVKMIAEANAKKYGFFGINPTYDRVNAEVQNAK